MVFSLDSGDSSSAASSSLPLLLGTSFASLVAYLYWFYSRPTHHGVPRVPAFPIIGNNLSLFLSPQDVTIQNYHRYGNIFVSNILGADTYIVLGEEANRWVFRGDNKYLKVSWPSNWKLLMGSNSLPVVDASRHKLQRQILAPLFHPKMMEAYLGPVEKLTRLHLAQMAEESQGVKGLNVFEPIKQYGFDVALRVMLNLEPGVVSREVMMLFTRWTNSFASFLPYELPWTGLGQGMDARRKIFDVIRKLLAQRGADPIQDSFDFVATVQESKDEHGNKITEEELLDQLLVFLFAGHDTVTSTTCSLLYVLGSQPEIKAKLLQEIRETFPDRESPLDYGKLMSMPYLEAFIKEVLRVYPPVNGGFRETTEDTTFGDYTIPKGSKVLYSIPFTNGIFQKGDTFNPSRFLVEEGGKEEEERRFLTFGNGPHMCIGLNFAKLEMKVLTVTLLRGYQLELVSSKRSYFPMFRETPVVRIGGKKDV